jgi:hypothetical protein
MSEREGGEAVNIVVLIKQCWLAARPVFGDGPTLMRGYSGHESDDDLTTTNGTYYTLNSCQVPLTKSDKNTIVLHGSISDIRMSNSSTHQRDTKQKCRRQTLASHRIKWWYLRLSCVINVLKSLPGLRDTLCSWTLLLRFVLYPRLWSTSYYKCLTSALLCESSTYLL